jgi:uncharacterized protein YmfQ (DUF2313 family)
MNRHADLLKLLLPPVAYDRRAPRITAEVEAVGARLDAFNAEADSLQREIDPRTASALLPDWERVYGLPDECRGAADMVADRRARLAAKVAETGGLSKSYFIGIATALGYQNVTIDRFRPTTCEASCEAALMDEAWRAAWRINVPGQQDIYRAASCESVCEEPLDAYKQGPLECLIDRLKPADSIALFNYGEP